MSDLNLGQLNYDRKYLRDIIFEKLNAAIMDGTLAQGQKITEQQISKEFGVSRTPVREALYKLTATGLVRIIPHQGFLVSKWSAKEIKDVFEIRIVLERLAIELFIKNHSQKNIDTLRDILRKMENAAGENNFVEAAKMNNDFHDLIVRQCGNDEIFHIMEPLKNRISIFRLISISIPSRVDNSLKEHKGILNSIERKNIEEAKGLIEAHIGKVLEIIENKLMEEQHNKSAR